MCAYRLPGYRDTQYLYGDQNLNKKQRYSINCNFYSLKYYNRDIQYPN